MGIYITRRCPHCKHSFELLEPAKEYFGDPRTQCKSCSKTFLRPNVIEWHYRKDKILIWLSSVLVNSILYSIGVLLLIGIVAVFILKFEESLVEKYIVPVSIFVFILIFWKNQKYLSNSIHESNDRLMNDLEYKKEMNNIYR